MREYKLNIDELKGKESNLLRDATKNILEKESLELTNPFSKHYENYSSLGNKIIGQEY